MTPMGLQASDRLSESILLEVWWLLLCGCCVQVEVPSADCRPAAIPARVRSNQPASAEVEGRGGRPAHEDSPHFLIDAPVVAGSHLAGPSPPVS